LQFPFPGRAPPLYFFYTLAQSRRLPPSCYFSPRSINMDMRSAASRARRERYDNRTEPSTRASADNRIRIATPSDAALGPTRDPLSLPPLCREFTRHTLSSKFRRISLKTKKSDTNKVTLTLQGVCHQSRVTNQRFFQFSLRRCGAICTMPAISLQRGAFQPMTALIVILA